ncbi:MAG: TonB-dependent receptor [Acidobacteriota bacterium]
MVRQIIWIFTIILTGVQAYAQSDLNEVVVVSADQIPVGFENLSRTVTVLHRDQINRIPASSVNDLLRYVASVEVKSRSPFGTQSDISIRGAGFGRTLILVNGVRMNDSQTGHHNADLPVSVSDIERIEVLHGPSSSVHGADAFGGTINIITRGGQTSPRVSLSAGQHGLVDGSAAVGFKAGKIRQSFSFWGNRSSGFMPDRDFRTLGIGSQTSFGDNTKVNFSHVDKAFGANQFYGPSPSREWTNGTLVSLKHQFHGPGPLNLSFQGFYRTHGDRFLWDVRQPGFFENRHRTHAAGSRLTATRTFSEAVNLVFGSEFGGDWIRSGNLGDHQFFRSGLFAQIQYTSGSNTSLTAGMRWDHTTSFGGAINPSISSGWWVHPAVRLRASAGHAFRIPTFTEQYYADPNHQAGSSLQPESSWETEAGIDWFPSSSWLLRGNVFYRWEDDVIDWIRSSSEDKWQSMNIREMEARGVEVSLERPLGTGALVQIQYSYLNLMSDEFTLLSKYIFDYPRHSLTGFSSVSLPLGLSFSQRIDFKKRNDGRNYWIVDARLVRNFDETSIFAEVTNLLNTSYQELLGVDMPGRWFRAGFTWKIF